VARDVVAGTVVFLVALPLCLGVALASNAPLFSGLAAGIVGGIVVGLLSGSHTIVCGPAAGLTTIVAAQIALLGSFRGLQTAVVLAGLIQIVLGAGRAGFIAAFFPSSVVKGLLAAIGLILILKQIPHVLGHDPDPEGEMTFYQPDRENTFSELGRMFGDLHPGAAAVGLVSLAFLIAWGFRKPTRSSLVPAPLIVVILGVAMSLAFQRLGGAWAIQASHLVQVPASDSLADVFGFFQTPDFTLLWNPSVYVAALTIAAVASLQSLLNLEVIDKLDPQQRSSPPSRELLAQGLGNLALGMIGGLPVTSVVARSAVNINAGARTKRANIVHGGLLLISVLLFPTWLNLIPLSCLAAILLVTGVKLARPSLFKQMWSEGRSQFIPFAVTTASIVLTDLLTGVLIGLATSIAFILASNVRRPLRRIVEKQLGGEVVTIQFGNQVSFLNRAALTRALDEIPHGGHVLLDARAADYIDPDLLDLIRDYEQKTAPARDIEVSLLGFRSRYQMEDRTRYVDYSSREIQRAVTPQQVLQILKDGHERFLAGRSLTRDLGRQVQSTASGQHPLAVVLSCIDSRAPAELIFDTGLGDIFSVRVAGNITSRKVLGSMEYATAVAGVKLILVMGHTRCGAVTAAVDLVGSSGTAAEATGCQHLDPIIGEIQQSVDPLECKGLGDLPPAEKRAFVDGVARRNVSRVVEAVLHQSETINALVREGKIMILGAVYDVVTGDIEYLPAPAREPEGAAAPA